MQINSEETLAQENAAALQALFFLLTVGSHSNDGDHRNFLHFCELAGPCVIFGQMTTLWVSKTFQKDGKATKIQH